MLGLPLPRSWGAGTGGSGARAGLGGSDAEPQPTFRSTEPAGRRFRGAPGECSRFVITPSSFSRQPTEPSDVMARTCDDRAGARGERRCRIGWKSARRGERSGRSGVRAPEAERRCPSRRRLGEASVSGRPAARGWFDGSSWLAVRGVTDQDGAGAGAFSLPAQRRAAGAVPRRSWRRVARSRPRTGRGRTPCGGRDRTGRRTAGPGRRGRVVPARPGAMSARSSAVGPGPLRSTPTTPVSPTLSVVSNPASCSQARRSRPYGSRRRTAPGCGAGRGTGRERSHGTTLVAEPDQPDRRHPARGPSGRHRSGAQRSWSGGRSTRFSSGGP